MRSLCVQSLTQQRLPPTHSAHIVAASAIDTDEDILYLVSERIGDEVEVCIWRAIQDEDELLATFTTPANMEGKQQIVSFTHMPDSHTLCIITRSGDILSLPLESPLPSTEVVGAISPGISTASFSPDSALLALITSSSVPNLILMTPSFDVLSEAPLHTADYGEDAPINVGWGSKTTQFHGSLGKEAAAEKDKQAGSTSPDDDGQPRISWRGDAQFFTVSALSPRHGPSRPHRILRLYSRLAALQSTAEHVLGLEHVLAWRTSGALIAGAQRFGSVPGARGAGNGEAGWSLAPGLLGRHDIVFFERNGLRHGQFSLREASALSTSGSVTHPWGYRLRELTWNADGSILGVWIERNEEDVVQLWTTANYHWYLKLEFADPGASVPEKGTRFTSIAWHPEDNQRLILCTHNRIVDLRIMSYTAATMGNMPYDTGLVGVVDGEHVLLTPFRLQNIPPPMSSHRLLLTEPTQSNPTPPPLHIAFSPSLATSTDTLAALFPDGHVRVWDLRSPVRKGKAEVDARMVWEGVVGRGRQVCVRGMHVCVLAVARDGRGDMIHVVVRGKAGDVRVRMPGWGGRLVEEFSAEGVVWQATDGGLWEVNLDEGQEPRFVGRFPEFCPSSTKIAIASEVLFIGLAGSRLYVMPFSPISPDSPVSDHPLPPHILLSPTCTSYTVTGSHLIWTATAPIHEAVFAPLGMLRSANQQHSPFERRRIERGARIVTAVPSTMSLVLQMPRGNLETIMPRPLVMEHVRADVRRGDYRSAFLACRKHRVDLNVLVEQDPATFSASLATFVEQLDNVDYINLFLSGLGRSSQSPELISALCDGIRTKLEERDVKKFVNTILTAHVVKTPPDYEAGLTLLLRLRGTDPELMEDAVKYIIFLVDADRLFDTALGMYDFSLVLLVAQHSQKVSRLDPREYLPFLRALRAFEGPYQHFKIDDHLGRHGKALQSLHRAGAERFGEAKAYVERHQLYDDALRIWKEEPEKYKAMLELYGDYMFERREYQRAGLAFIQSSRSCKAMVAYEKALDWQQLFNLVMREGIAGDELVDVARRVAEDLGSKRRHAEAARVLLDYVNNVDEAVTFLVRGSEWSEARRIISLHKRDDLVTSLIYPGTLEGRASISEEISEIRELLEKQVARLDELAAKKLAEPDAFYGIEDANLANVDVMTDVSNPGTMFTRYTTAPTASSTRSRRTSRSKRKLDRKAGRRGTVEEEEYLLQGLTKLAARLEVVEVEAQSLLPCMLVLSDEHAAGGRDLQVEVETLDRNLRDAVDRIWKEREQSPPLQEHGATPGTLPHGERSLKHKAPKPRLPDLPWEVEWLSKI